MLVLAEGWDMVAGGFNPCRGVPEYAVQRRERFLTDAEFKRADGALDEAKDMNTDLFREEVRRRRRMTSPAAAMRTPAGAADARPMSLERL